MTQPSPRDNHGAQLAPSVSTGEDAEPRPTEPRTTVRRRAIALATTELAVGGAERCLTNLALGLTRRGWSVEVYSLRAAPPASQDSLVRQLQAADVPLHFLDLRGIFSLPRTAFRFRTLLARQRPALLQTFLFHANVLGAVVARGAGVPHVTTGVRVADPRRARLRCERWFTRHVDAVVCVSDAVADHSRDVAGFDPAKLLVIPNGVDIGRYEHASPASAAELGVALGRRLLLSIGRLDPQKGFDRVLACAPRLFAALPNHDWVVVGEGPQRAALVAQTAAAGVAERVHFVGRRAPEELPALLAAADVVLIPSRWEGMPNVLLEAMAAARPVVATDVEGVRQVLGDELIEQMVAQDDLTGFIERAVAGATFAAARESSSDGSDELGRRNRDRVAQEYSLEAMVDRYERLYESLLERP